MAKSTIGSTLRAARERAGKTLNEVAAASGIAPSVLSRLERGVQADLRLASAARLAAVLGLPLNDLAAGKKMPVLKRRRSPNAKEIGALRKLLRAALLRLDRIEKSGAAL